MIYLKAGEKLADQHLLEYSALIDATLAEIEAGVLSEGTHQLSEDLMVNIFSYDTADTTFRAWEAHEVHIDYHVLLKGKEIVEFSATESYEKEEIDLVNDSYSFAGRMTESCQLEVNDRLIIYPNEGHKTGVRQGETSRVSKAVFKIKVK